ncbi:MAG: hypothetical protein V1733_11615 [bacterium]
MALILTLEDVIRVLSMKECMAVVEQAFREMKALACKVVAVYKDNPARHNLPTTIGKVLLQDPETGEVVCIMDGGYLTAVRTGAASGVATKYLANDVPGMTAGIFGAGVQAKTQLWAVSEARTLARAFVYDKDPAVAGRFATEMSEKLHLEVIPADEGRGTKDEGRRTR